MCYVEVCLHGNTDWNSYRLRYWVLYIRYFLKLSDRFDQMKQRELILDEEDYSYSLKEKKFLYANGREVTFVPASQAFRSTKEQLDYYLKELKEIENKLIEVRNERLKTRLS